ncbi:MAG: peptidoglycan binding domain-containing protein, partial [Thermomicrobiales bacterium]
MISRRGLVAGAFGTTVATAALALPARSQGQFYPGASVQGIAIEGMSQSDSEEMLRAAFTPLEDQAVTYTFEDQTWPASLTDLGMIVDYESMLEQAWNQGRDGSVIDRYATLLNQGDTHNVPLSVLQDDLKLSAFLENIGEQLHIDSKNARLVRRGSEIDILADATGRALDLEAARNETIAAVLTGRTSTVALKSIPIPPDVTAADLEGAKEDAITLVGEPVIFTYGDISYDIDTEELTGALTIDRDGTAVLNLEKLQGRLDDIAADVLTPAANAKLGWDDGVYVIEDDIDGTGLDLEAIGPLLLDTARTTTRSVPLPVQTLKAGARADNIEELGLDGHLTYGSSSFAGSSETRAANVIAACDNVSYKLVGPGEQFSFNDQMGQISIENGFV